MGTVTEKTNQPAVLAKVKPAPWRDPPLVENRRSFQRKFVELLNRRHLYGGGGALSQLFVLQVSLAWVLFISYQLALVFGVITTLSIGGGLS